MSGLPVASCKFNIPNLNDELLLSCRLYYPKLPVDSISHGFSGFAILAHPYAPLGGCYDDPIVQGAGSTLLQQGFVLCTFNFRGATSSPGSTSWTAKPELADYVSVFTFMLHLMNCSDVLEHVLLLDGRPLLILSGYSYGSMITSNLPDLGTIVAAYMPKTPADHEIELKAQEIAPDFLRYLETQRYRGRRNRQKEDGTGREIVSGGYGSGSPSRRLSRDSARRSIDMDRIRHSFDRVKNKLNLKTHRGDAGEQQPEHNDVLVDSPAFAVRPWTAYLLISPLLPPIAGFTTMFSRLTFERKTGLTDAKPQKLSPQNLTDNSTLAIFGDKDMFTSVRKLRKWSQELQNIPGSHFISKEVAGAGHFWREDGAYEILLTSIRDWTQGLLSQEQLDGHITEEIAK